MAAKTTGRLTKQGLPVHHALDASPVSRTTSPITTERRTPRTNPGDQIGGADGTALIPGLPNLEKTPFYQDQQKTIPKPPPTLADVMEHLADIQKTQKEDRVALSGLIKDEVSVVKESVKLVDAKVCSVEARVTVLERKDDKVIDEVQQMQKRLAKLEFAATKSSLTISGFSSSTSHEDRIKIINKKLKDICGAIAGFVAPNHLNTFTKDKSNTSCTLIEFPTCKSRNVVLTAFKDLKWSIGSSQIKVNHAKTPEQLRKHYLMTQAEAKAKAVYPDHIVEVLWMQWPRLVTVKAKGDGQVVKTVFEQSKGDDGKWLDGDSLMGDDE